MEMKVDSYLVRSERKKRAWSQEHLARASGLGHRTIQRIENTGLASYESVMAIASALDLDTAALGIEEDSASSPAGTPEVRQLPIRLELPARLLLAVISGILVPLILALDFYQTWGGTRDYFGKDLLHELVYPFCGALFGFTVLCPYLKRDNKLLRNSLLLTAAGAVSFYSAGWVSALLLGINAVFAFMAASLLGAAIVVVASKRTMPVEFAKITWLRLMFAATAGGAAVYVGLVLVSDYAFGTLAAVLGFCSWHCALSVMLYYGRSIDASGNRPGSILMDLLVRITAKSKLRGYYFGADNSLRWDGSFSYSERAGQFCI